MVQVTGGRDTKNRSPTAFACRHGCGPVLVLLS